MDISLSSNVPALTVFIQGILSFFSPCVFPLLPVYIGYLSGGTGKRDETGRVRYDRKKVMINTFFFVLGISFAFFLLALGMNAIGVFFGGNKLLFARIGGVIIFLFGLYQLGFLGNNMFLSGIHQLPVEIDKLKMSPFTALVMGFIVSFAWTPCIGPTLSSVLIMAGSAATTGKGFMLIGIYTLGYVIPFLMVGLFTTTLLEFFGKHRSVVRYTAKAGGVLLLLMGILMFTGQMNGITGYLSTISADSGFDTGNLYEDSDAANVFESGTVASNQSGSAEEVSGSGETLANASEVGSNVYESRDGLAGETLANASGESTNEYKTEDISGEESLDQDSKENESAESDTDKIPAPDFVLKDQYGNTHSLSDYRGKIVFLNFWATWCPPCRAEMPYIEELYQEYSQMEDSDVVFLGVASPGIGKEKDAEAVKAFLNENGYTFPTVIDESGDMLRAYYINAFPTTFIIDYDGNVLGYVPGAMTKDIMKDIIRQAKEA